MAKEALDKFGRVVDQHMDRRLAIKLCRQNRRSSVFTNLRLEREAKLTGSLQHPGVPPVFDHGRLSDGSKFFAMKLVEGETLDAILSARTDSDAFDSDLPKLVGIFEQISQTVAYAHAQGIIHRDLKPQNVMVGKFGEVQVMDWGMGKRLSNEESGSEQVDVASFESKRSLGDSEPSQRGETVATSNDSSLDDLNRAIDYEDPLQSLTQTGEIFGTPAYMAPEQARGDIQAVGTQSDVFGLGAILYSILTGSRLHSQLDADQVILKAASGELSDSIKKLNDLSVDKELEQLCLDCLETNPDNRPVDGAAVASRVKSYQEGVQLRLKQAELDQQAAELQIGEETRRRKTVTRSLAAILVAITAGLIGVIWQWRAADQANELALHRLRETQTVVDEFYSKIAEESGLLSQTPGTQELRKALLEKARDYYVKLIADFKNDPDAYLETARACSRLAVVLGDLDPGADEAITLREEAAGYLEKLIAEHQGDPVYKHWEELADAKYGLAQIFQQRNDYQHAQTHYESAEETVIEWLELFDQPKVELQLAKTEHNIGQCMSALKNHEDAMAQFVAALGRAETAFALFQSQDDDEDVERDFLRNIATMNLSIGTQYGWYQKKGVRSWALARDFTVKAVDIYELLAERFPDHPAYRELIVLSLNNLGMIHYNLKVDGQGRDVRVKRCQQCFDRAIEIGQDLMTKNPGVPKYAASLGKQHLNYATFMFYNKDLAGCAEKTHQAALLYKQIALGHPQVFEFTMQAIRSLEMTAAMNGDAPESYSMALDCMPLYRQLIQLRPDKLSHKMAFALRSGVVIRDRQPELLELTVAIPRMKAPSIDRLVVRAFAHFRNEEIAKANEIFDQLEVEEDQPRHEKATFYLVRALIGLAQDDRDIAEKDFEIGLGYSERKKNEKPPTRAIYNLLLVKEFEELAEML